MGILLPDMLDREGKVLESTRLGDMAAIPLYGTGDQGNGYPYTKYLGEKMVFQAGRRGLPVVVHRPGLIGGHSKTGDMAEDVFFHFLTDVVKQRWVPKLEGDKFNLTPVDFVAKGIVNCAINPAWSSRTLTAIHPAVSNNTVTMLNVEQVLKEMGYTGLQWMDFVQWRAHMLARPEDFKSWSFAAMLVVEGNGLDSMADNRLGLQSITEAVGEDAVAAFNTRDCLRKMIRSCQEKGSLPMPDVTPVSRGYSSFHPSRAAAQPLLDCQQGDLENQS